MGCVKSQDNGDETETDTDSMNSISTPKPPTNNDIAFKSSVSPIIVEPPPNPKLVAYRTKKVIVYKPKIQTQLNPKNKHQTQTSKDDLNLYFDTKRRHYTNSNDYDIEHLTDRDIDNDDDMNEYDMYDDLDDNQTVIHHDSFLLNYESDDTVTYQAYGGHSLLINNNNSNSSNILEEEDEDEDEDEDDETSAEKDAETASETENVEQIDKNAILRKILMNSKNIQNNKSATDTVPQDKDKQIRINLVRQTLNNITKENCLQKLESLGIVTYIFVEINEFDRWNNRNVLNKIINSGGDNHEMYQQNPTKYIKMINITLANSKLLITLSETEKKLFKTLILYGMEQSKLIYKINFNSANITNSFLYKILQVLENRDKNINNYYGPQLFFIENNPISDRGIEMFCNFIKQSGAHLKCVAVGHCFANISADLCLLFCESLKCNEFILKIIFDLKNVKHRESVDTSLKSNYAKYREKENNQICKTIF